jgi:ABC-2 type transport system permease protein
MAFTAVFYAVVVFAIAGVWRSAAIANGNDIAGYSAVAIVWYLAISEAVTISMNNRLIADIGGDVVSGAIAVELLRPVSVVWHRVTVEVGRSMPRLMLCALIGVPVAAGLGGAPPDPAALALAVPGAALAVVSNIVGQHAFASAAFWLRETGATWFLYQKLVFVLGGMLIPLQVLPGWLRTIAWATPFPAMAYAPARLAAGHVEPELLALQAGWIAVLAAVCAAVFGAGERRLQVVGG